MRHGEVRTLALGLGRTYSDSRCGGGPALECTGIGKMNQGNPMKSKTLFVTCALFAAFCAEARKPNYDEAQIKPYVNADPLTFLNGKKLASRNEWPARRKEIVEIFSREMYGQPLPAPETVVTEMFESGKTLDDQAVREQVRMWFKKDKSGPSINWLIVRPAYAQGPVPVIVMLNYRGNQELLTDPEVPVMQGWVRNGKYVKDHRVQESSRGALRRTDSVTQFPIETIIARGYAVMTACYAEVTPDPDRDSSPKEPVKAYQDRMAYTGVFDLFPGIRDPKRNDNPTSLGAWAWAISRAVDYIERDPVFDAKKIVATGCSRLAKAPLLAASRDERIAVVIPNQTGGGGVPLARRDFGENVSTEMNSFTHWYCEAYNKYVDNEENMLFDQHFLVASIAPRRILVQGFNSPWFDTKGEYLSCKAASCVWDFLGLPGLPDHPFPEDFSKVCVGPYIGYYRRAGQHGVNGFDWMMTLDFADRAFAEGKALSREEITADAKMMRAANAAAQAKLSDAASVTDYAQLVRTDAKGRKIWTDAYQRALDEHEIVRIPASEEVYWIDRTVTVPSNRRIEAADSAVTRLTAETTTLMLRNRSTVNGARLPVRGQSRDANIAIVGGRWEESHAKRAGYGRTGKYDEKHSFPGVSTCFLFNNVNGVTLRDLTFRNTAGFAVQVGEISDFSADHIRFDHCFADGLHINGNTYRVYVSDVSGQVGDDLVALNAYDWKNSSVNFGPMRRVLCENLVSPPDGGYKAMRILPGVYQFADGSKVDCAITDLVIDGVSGVNTFKMYLQTPRYKIGTDPEYGEVGTLGNVFFRNVKIDMSRPADMLEPYMKSDPLRGTIAAFEFGSRTHRVVMERVEVTLHRDRFPHSYIACVGPKSVVAGEYEIFDPYLSSHVEELVWKDVSVNGKALEDLAPYLHEITFNNINNDGRSTGEGRLHKVRRAE